jgi:peptide/nickel transport system permease protein
MTTFFAYFLAIPLGLAAGRFKETVIDKAIIFYTYFALSMPTIVLALIFMFIFGFNLRWFPIAGSVDVTLAPGSFAQFASRMYHLILPAFTGALLSTTALINQLRSEIIDNENSDYVTTARSKGVPKRKVYTRHIFRNSSLPIVSSLGMAVAFFLTGSIFIELLFSFPGMGNLFFTAINQRDFPVTNALIMIYAILLVSGALISDVLMSIVDPRVRIK